jgi:hypothetical protein
LNNELDSTDPSVPANYEVLGDRPLKTDVGSVYLMYVSRSLLIDSQRYCSRIIRRLRLLTRRARMSPEVQMTNRQTFLRTLVLASYSYCNVWNLDSCLVRILLSKG